MELRVIKSINKELVLATSFVVPVIVDVLFTYTTYKGGVQPDGKELLSALVVGLLIITQYKVKTWKGKALVITLYVPVLIFMLLIASVITSCLNGDCL